jgi:hypothetical protein
MWQQGKIQRYFFSYGIAVAAMTLISEARKKYMNFRLSNPLYSSWRAWGKSKWYIVTWGWIPAFKWEVHELSLRSWTFEKSLSCITGWRIQSAKA